jgi:hypothetical protein
MLWQAWSAWLQGVYVACERRRLALQLSQTSSYRLKAACFIHWSERTQTQRSTLRKCEHCASTSCATPAAMSGMVQSHAGPTSAACNAREHADSQRKFWLQASALQSWAVAAAIQRHVRSLVAHGVQTRVHRLACTSLRAWHTITAQAKHTVAMHDQATAHHWRSRCQQVLDKWRGSTQQCDVSKIAVVQPSTVPVAQSSTLASRELQACIMRAWAHLVVTRRRVQSLRTRRSHTLLTKSWQAWRQSRVSMRMALIATSRHLQISRLRRTWHMWKQVALQQSSLGTTQISEQPAAESVRTHRLAIRSLAAISLWCLVISMATR